MDTSLFIEEYLLEEFSNNPLNEHTQFLLSQILHH